MRHQSSHTCSGLVGGLEIISKHETECEGNKVSLEWGDAVRTAGQLKGELMLNGAGVGGELMLNALSSVHREQGVG